MSNLYAKKVQIQLEYKSFGNIRPSVQVHLGNPLRALCLLHKGGEGQLMLQPGIGFDGSPASVLIVI